MSRLLVDRATGSNELVEPLKRFGLPAELAHLEYGDIAFMGRGEQGADLYVGIELKKVAELAQSLVTKRFQGHQLIGLTRDFDRRYLVIEGDYHHNERGQVVVFRGAGRPKPLHAAANALVFEEQLINLQTRGGLWIRHTTGRRDTLRFIAAAFRYWTDKDLDRHKSHMAVYAPDVDPQLLAPSSDFRAAIQRWLPGVGFAASAAIERACAGKMRRLMLWGEREWAELAIPDGRGNPRKLGTKRARQIMEAIDNG